ncbi:MAG: hypothetical protein ABIP75_05560 [Pyrinomonadaceae bacterium]
MAYKIVDITFLRPNARLYKLRDPDNRGRLVVADVDRPDTSRAEVLLSTPDFDFDDLRPAEIQEVGALIKTSEQGRGYRAA